MIKDKTLFIPPPTSKDLLAEINKLSAHQMMRFYTFVQNNVALHKYNEGNRYETSEVQILSVFSPGAHMDESDKLNYLKGIIVSFTHYGDDPEPGYLCVILTECNGFKIMKKVKSFQEAELYFFHKQFINK